MDRPIPGTEGVVGSPFFSPDGESVGVFVAGSLRKISLARGSPITLCTALTLRWVEVGVSMTRLCSRLEPRVVRDFTECQQLEVSRSS